MTNSAAEHISKAGPIPNFLSVRIVSSRGLLYQGEATSVSAINSAGKFDILPGHANFLTLVQKTPIIIRAKDKALTYNFPLSIIHNSQNQVDIYTDLNIQMR